MNRFQPFLIILIILFTAINSYALSDRGFVDEFIGNLEKGKLNIAESMLSFDADPSLRISIIDEKNIRETVEGIKKLRFLEEKKFKNETWIIYKTDNGREYLSFILKTGKNSKKVYKLIPLLNNNFFKFRIRLSDKKKLDTFKKIYDERFSHFTFSHSLVVKEDNSLIINTLGMEDIDNTIALLRLNGEFSLRKILSRGRNKLDYFPIYGLNKKRSENVHRRSLINSDSISSSKIRRTSLGMYEIIINTKPEGTRKLINLYRTYANSRRKIELAAVLDSKIIKRVQMRKSFLKGIFIIEEIPRNMDALLFSAIISSPPLPEKNFEIKDISNQEQ